MDVLDLDEGTEMTLVPVPRVPDWPTRAVLILSASGIVSALVFRAWIPAVITYAVLLIVGCGLLYYRRYLAISATRKAGGIGYVSIGKMEGIALWVLVASCVVNGVFIALEIASLEWLS